MFIFELSLGLGDSLSIGTSQYTGSSSLVIPVLPFTSSTTIKFVSNCQDTGKGLKIIYGCYGKYSYIHKYVQQKLLFFMCKTVHTFLKKQPCFFYTALLALCIMCIAVTALFLINVDGEYTDVVKKVAFDCEVREYLKVQTTIISLKYLLKSSTQCRIKIMCLQSY